MSTVWTRVRRVIWSWFPWAAVAVYLVSRHDWWWAAGVGAAGVPLNNRTHRKSLIIDGRIGFTGSAGIADHWTGNAQDDKHRRDLQIRFEGPTVQPLQTGFAPNWLECTGELVTGATARGNINNWRGRKRVPWDTDTF